MSGPLTYFQTDFTAEDIPELAGKHIIVTGGNCGLGYETVKQLAKKGAHVFMASRSPERAQEALAKLKKEIGDEAAARVEFLKLDLQDLKQVKAAADEFLAKNLPLHVLVNNAGIMVCPFALTKDGIETQFGTNHVGHFLFTTALLPGLEAGQPARVVNVSSYGHNHAPEGGILFDKINDEKISPWARYGQSKLANILFTKGFDKRFGDKGIYANSLHPGAVKTELKRGIRELYGLDRGLLSLLSPLFRFLESLVTIDVDKGALTQLYLATSPHIVEKSIRAKYFIPFGHEYDGDGLSKYARDDKLADKLWDWTAKTVDEKLRA